MSESIFPASKMGFGCMRLPLLDENDPKSIDIIDQLKRAAELYE